jgi:hypothetical protein
MKTLGVGKGLGLFLKQDEIDEVCLPLRIYKWHRPAVAFSVLLMDTKKIGPDLKPPPQHYKMRL